MGKYDTNNELYEAYDAQAELEGVSSYKNENLTSQVNELLDVADMGQLEYSTAAEDDLELLSIYEELLGKKLAKEKEEANSLETQKRREHYVERALRRKERKRRIIQEAFNQEDINLNDMLHTGHCSLLIQVLTQGITNSIKKYDDYINKRCEFVLSKFIPTKLIHVAKFYPKSIKVSPGFLYTVPSDDPYKARNTFWVKPNIPVYFEQGSERDIINSYNPEIREAIDSAVVTYNSLVTARKKLEVKYGSALVMHGITHYDDLLKYKPEWFEIIYNNVTGKRLVPKNDEGL